MPGWLRPKNVYGTIAEFGSFVTGLAAIAAIAAWIAARTARVPVEWQLAFSLLAVITVMLGALLLLLARRTVDIAEWEKALGDAVEYAKRHNVCRAEVIAVAGVSEQTFIVRAASPPRPAVVDIVGLNDTALQGHFAPGRFVENLKHVRKQIADAQGTHVTAHVYDDLPSVRSVVLFDANDKPVFVAATWYRYTGGATTGSPSVPAVVVRGRQVRDSALVAYLTGLFKQLRQGPPA